MISKQISFGVLTVVLIALISQNVSAQRPSYAGSRPQSGYKDRFRPIDNTQQQDIVSRFGEDDINRVQRPPVIGSDIVQPIQTFIPINDRFSNQNPDLSNRNSIESATGRLPYDALGDRELVDRLNRLPQDQRPFWLVNAQAIEAHRNRSAGSQSGAFFNSIAERGSFAGSGFSSRFNNENLSQQRQPEVLSSRGDINRVSASNNILRQQRPVQQTASSSNFVDNNSANGNDGGRFIYVGPQLYEQLRRANIIV